MTKPTSRDVEERLEEIALSIADDLLDAGAEKPALTEKIAGFKALSNYLAMKHKIDPPFDREPGGALDDYRKHVASASGGGKTRRITNGAGSA